MTVLILNGPNLNLLGTREPEIYGATTLPEIEQLTLAKLKSADLSGMFFQSNAEHEIVDSIQKAPENDVDFIIINPAAFTHTSVAIRDALAAVGIPFIEVHLSNPHSREPFRQHSYFSDIAVGVIAGFGVNSYLMACDMAIERLQD
ncbi:type II 3-dehydroquinate dehydratase [Aliikangiella coralliicola]|uniref:3-dehydroquinate dehydratase n=1 Tax=Aliikangiella coralliicola TaxID=2592383 RepID=A0A545UI51_9GAMM|nr:type II 3-dehydroquinate dehydratase [Aliikangiella coralliicola]TQV89146.1 type II 3-dehydroquinate dehydratase [Aliikangiella coralliicola]